MDARQQLSEGIKKSLCSVEGFMYCNLQVISESILSQDCSVETRVYCKDSNIDLPYRREHT